MDFLELIAMSRGRCLMGNKNINDVDSGVKSRRSTVGTTSAAGLGRLIGKTSILPDSIG